MSFQTASELAWSWRCRLLLACTMRDADQLTPWHAPGSVDDVEFVPLLTAADLSAEATGMQNCVETYATWIANGHGQLWSLRRDGLRIATVQIGRQDHAPWPSIQQLRGPENALAPIELWWTARRWLEAQDPARVMPYEAVKLDVSEQRAAWQAIWQPYWLSRRRVISCRHSGWSAASRCRHRPTS